MFWHVYTYHDPDTDLFSSATVGPTKFNVGDVGNNGKRPEDITLPLWDNLQMTWRKVYDHDPTQDELDLIRPEGHRTYDRTDDWPEDDDTEIERDW